MAVATDTPSVNSSASPLTAMRVQPGLNRTSSAGSAPRMSRTPHSASSEPSAPPMSASDRLSASICRIRSPRVAPNATRTASSRPRVVARARMRFATFAQPISRTNATDASRTTTYGRGCRP